jgi:hypothetical protein
VTQVLLAGVLDPDINAGIKLFRQSAAQGYSIGQQNLGRFTDSCKLVRFIVDNFPKTMRIQGPTGPRKPQRSHSFQWVIQIGLNQLLADPKRTNLHESVNTS